MAEEQGWVQALVQELRRRRRPLAAPSFDGTSDVRKFLETFNQIDLEKALYFKLALRGTTADCTHGETFEEMAESLLTRFELSKEEARKELKNLKLRPDKMCTCSPIT